MSLTRVAGLRPATAMLCTSLKSPASFQPIPAAESNLHAAISTDRGSQSRQPCRRFAFTTSANNRQPLNPHSARRAAIHSPIAVSSLGGFPTPAAEIRPHLCVRPASENLHTLRRDGMSALSL
jgi:hypothetical protein